MKKRIPILFLAAIMMLTLLPAPALAASGDFIIREGELRFYTGNDEFVVIPSNVTSIGNGGVFRGKKLTGVTIPDSVISIGSTAFDSCENLTSIIIPDSVTSIGNFAFAYCSELESVTLPAHLTAIGDNVFVDCKKLTGIRIPDSVTSIGSGAFSRTGLTDVTIPNSVTSIGNNAFQYTSLTSVTIPDSVTSIGSTAFGNCSNLTRVVIGKGVTEIGPGVFFDSKMLSAITIPANVTKIDDTAFKNCLRLTIFGEAGSEAERYAAANGIPFRTGTAPDNLSDLFDGSDHHFTVEDGVLTYYEGPGYDVVIPDGVIAIAHDAFKDYGQYITSVVVPEGVVALGGHLSVSSSTSADGTTTVTVGSYTTSGGERGAFAYCSNLTEVTLPSSLQYMGYNSFRNDTKLEKVNFPEEGALSLIAGWTFQDCTSLKSIAFPKSTTIEHNIDPAFEIAYGIFSGCTALETVTLSPANSYKIGAMAFSGCTNLKTIQNAQGITGITGIDPFSRCTSLRNMTISEELDAHSITQLYDTPWYQERFSGQEFVVRNGALINYTGPGGDVVIPGDLGITSIAFQFKECRDEGRALTSVVIPEGVTAIDQSAFYFCRELTDVTLPDSLLYIEANAFNHCDTLNSITFPDSLLYIGFMAFGYCDALNNVVIPENTVIGERAFEYCKSLTNVTLPDTAVVECFVNGPTLEDGELWTSFFNTPFEAAELEAQKDSDFFMLGATLCLYQGPGGDVVLPENTRMVGYRILCGNDTITSITYPKAMQAWLDSVEENYDNPSVTGIAWVWGYAAIDHYYGCTRLAELVNAPIGGYSVSDMRRALDNLELFKLPLDPAGCLGTPSARITAQSNAIVTAAGASTDYEKARAIADWVAKNVKYDWDVYQKTKPSRQAVIDPEQILDGAFTICEGYTRLTNALLWAQGIPANYVIGKGNGEGHAWTEAYIDGRWVIIDSTWMAPYMNGTSTQVYDDSYFDPDIFYFSEKHIIEDRGVSKGSGTGEGSSFTDVPASAWYGDAVNWAAGKGYVAGTGDGMFTPDRPCTNIEILTFLWNAEGKPTAAASPLNVADWAQGPVNWAYEKGMIDETFQPYAYCTRATTVYYIWLVFGKAQPTAGNSFTDVPAGAYYADAVAWAVERNIVQGTGNGTYAPDAICNRAQIATFLHRTYVS